MPKHTKPNDGFSGRVENILFRVANKITRIIFGLRVWGCLSGSSSPGRHYVLIPTPRCHPFSLPVAHTTLPLAVYFPSSSKFVFFGKKKSKNPFEFILLRKNITKIVSHFLFCVASLSPSLSLPLP